ncbi:hypothetical protein C1280_15040 [Gemmata obscuriglobus]|uniref:Uncharacterized protein n=1 Tax=Gemmata obscuriglobus TaxID=114 RepID=A0A2Z3GZZ7_9BACT|nr:hypothetical protein C1280_15040 [Gemmata obscuriglobus]
MAVQVSCSFGTKGTRRCSWRSSLSLRRRVCRCRCRPTQTCRAYWWRGSAERRSRPPCPLIPTPSPPSLGWDSSATSSYRRRVSPPAASGSGRRAGRTLPYGPRPGTTAGCCSACTWARPPTTPAAGKRTPR